MNTKRKLIVYYTSSGNTGKVAQALAEALDADLDEITPVKRVDANIRGKGLRNFGNMGRVVLAGRRGRTVDLEPARCDPVDYDLVVVGTPVYADTLPAEPRSYLVANKGKFASLAFFCTGEDPANEHVFELMSKAAEQAPVAIKPFHAPKVIEDEYADDVQAFAEALLRE